MMTGNATLAGVIGWPVSHSLSPKLHNRWLKEHAIDGAYVPLTVTPEDLKATFHLLPRLGFKGWNITLPHKERALELVDEADAKAKGIGAVNTVVVREDGSLFGTNTDAYGFMENLHIKGGDVSSRSRIVVLGAGGAARAVIWGLKEAGVEEILLLNRTRRRGEEIAAAFTGVTVMDWQQRSEALEGAALLINTTTLGMLGQPPLELELAALPASALVVDIVYKPLMTPLLQMAQQRGNRIVTGLGMLVHQAVPGFAAWFGPTPLVTPELETWLAA